MATGIEATIRTAATRRLHATDAMIVRVVESHGVHGVDRSAGEWFGLSLLVDGAWKFVGRRRTRLELLTLCNAIQPHELDGKCFGVQRKPQDDL